MILFWQIIILINYYLIEKNILIINNFYNFKYRIGTFTYFLFILIGLQTIFNQLRYGVAIALIINAITLIILSLIYKNYTYRYIAYFLISISLFIHTLATLSILFIYLVFKLINSRISAIQNLLKVKLDLKNIFGIPIKILLFIFASLIVSYFVLNFAFSFIEFIPIINKITYASMIYFDQSPKAGILSLFFGLFNLFISYRALTNTNFKDQIPFFKKLFTLGVFSLIFAFIPYASRFTNLSINIPLIFFLSLSKLYNTYLFNTYSILLLIITIVRFNSLFPAL